VPTHRLLGARCTRCLVGCNVTRLTELPASPALCQKETTGVCTWYTVSVSSHIQAWGSSGAQQWPGPLARRMAVRLSTLSMCAIMPLQARSVSSDGLSRHGSGSMPEAGSHQHASQLQTAPSSSTQAASIDGELLLAVQCTGSGLATFCCPHTFRPAEREPQLCACGAAQWCSTQQVQPARQHGGHTAADRMQAHYQQGFALVTPMQLWCRRQRACQHAAGAQGRA
jgi:hypothetical protein